MTQNELKAQVGLAALNYVVPHAVLGVGTGSTVNYFIDALAGIKAQVLGVVSSSEQTTSRLLAHGFKILDCNEVDRIPVYIDGADEVDGRGCMIKGGGAALTREKIVADLAERFICIADASKVVSTLGRFPLPVEVIPMAAAQVARRFGQWGAQVRLRAGALTDNGCSILDVQGLQITDPLAMECEINQWPGVVTVGIFARQRAQVCLLSTDQGVKTLTF